MAQDQAREQLLDFVDKKAFQPVLNASPGDDQDEEDKKKLEGVQDKTRSTQQRYHNYDSAQQVREMFRDDLNSDAAEKVHQNLRELGLPTLNDIKDEFEQLADKLRVGH